MWGWCILLFIIFNYHKAGRTPEYIAEKHKKYNVVQVIQRFKNMRERLNTKLKGVSYKRGRKRKGIRLDQS